jgi:DNA-binding transcriptional regulator YiaG
MIPALAFCDFDAVSQISLFRRHTTSFLDLGRHIQERRTALQLSKDDLAALFDVTKDTIGYWETQQIAPDVTKFPMIIRFLGYNPFESDTDTLGGKITAYRYQNGLSQRKLARQLGVSFSAIKSWEENKFVPTSEHYQRLSGLIEH